MPHHHDDVPLQVLGWCVTLQVVGMLTEFFGGYMTHSYAVTSDGWHMAADVLPAFVLLLVRTIIQNRRRSGQIRHFSTAVGVSGSLNAATLLMAGVMAVREATPAVTAINRDVNFWPALGIAVIGLGCNWGGHRLLHRFSLDACEHDSRFDVASLSGHLLIDTIGSFAAVAFLLLNAFYRVSWWDTAGGIIIGWGMIGYSAWLLIIRLWSNKTSP